MSELNGRFAIITDASLGIDLRLTGMLPGHGATALTMAGREQSSESLCAHPDKHLH